MVAEVSAQVVRGLGVKSSCHRAGTADHDWGPAVNTQGLSTPPPLLDLHVTRPSLTVDTG